MAYSAALPPLLTRASRDGVIPNQWSYASANSFAQVAVSGFFADAANLGMRIGDAVIVSETDNAYSTAVFTVSDITAGAATVSRGQQLQTGPGVGITGGAGTIAVTSVTPFGAFIKTDILIDITGLNCGGSAGDIIGTDGAGAAYLGRLPASRCGTIIGGTMTCLETPTGGGTDIDLYAADEATGVEDTAITALTETQLINAGVASNGASDPMTALPTSNQYLYLVNQDAAPATYTGGVFLIEMWGIPV